MEVRSFSFDHVTRMAEVVDKEGKRITLPEMQRVKVTMWGFEDKPEVTILVIGGLVSYIRNGYVLLELEEL